MENEEKTTTISVEKLVDLINAGGWKIIDDNLKIEYDSRFKIPDYITLTICNLELRELWKKEEIINIRK